MMNRYFQVTMEVGGNEEQEILVAKLISIGFESFEQQSNKLIAFIPTSEFHEKEFTSLVNEANLQFDKIILEEKNWNEEWEKSFAPVVIGDFSTVRASFHPPNQNTDYEIVITPKMSFGTGHHATTYMMLQLMAEEDFTCSTVLDFGTGTGILSIMAEKLGADHIVAIDVDNWSIENAAENLVLNGCAKITLQKRDNIPLDKSFKKILANINRNVILETLPDLCRVLEAKGTILLSGLLHSDFDQIDAEATKLGLKLQKKGEKSGWIALRYNLLS
jgi:ribosomal protein L11 methyltransferase